MRPLIQRHGLFSACCVNVDISTSRAKLPVAWAPVTSIQRLQTVGGAAPAEGCAAAADSGKEARVTYTAQYVYFVRG